MKKLLFTLLVFTFSFSFGQLKQGAVIDTGVNQGNSIIQTTDGGYVIAGDGTYKSSDGVYVLKLDENFNMVWSKTIGIGQGNSVIQDAAGNYVIAGCTNVYGAGGYDVYVIKLDPSGNIIWTRTIGGTGNDIGNSVTMAKDGGYAVTGYTASYGAGGNDVYLMKLDTAGNLKWTKTIGGTGDDEGSSVDATKDGGFIVAGSTNSYGAGNYDVYVLKTDSLGNLQWTRTVGGTNADYGNSVIQTEDGGYAVAGQTASYGTKGNCNTYTVKLDASSNLKWAKAIGGGFESANGIAQTSNGILGVVGYTYYYGDGGTGSVYLLKLDTFGNMKSSRAEGEDETMGYGITATSDNGFATVGFGNWSPNYTGALIFKFDSVLNICITRYGGGNDSSGGILGAGGGTVGSGGAITSMNKGIDTNGRGVYNICELLTGEEDISPPISSVRVYPNPSRGVFNLQLSEGIPLGGNENQKLSVEVYSMLGEKIYVSSQYLIPTTNYQIDLSNNPPGIYLYRMLSEKGELLGSGKLEISK